MGLNLHKRINIEDDQIVIRIPKEFLDGLLTDPRGPFCPAYGTRKHIITNLDSFAEAVVSRMQCCEADNFTLIDETIAQHMAVIINDDSDYVRTTGAREHHPND